MNDKTILLSVIIPVFNTEEYLKKCLDSIVNQSLKNIEIILINDFSEGETDTIVKEYTDLPFFKYHKFSENRGLGAVRNYGIEQAKGKYITFCDSDDWVDVFLYENMINALNKNNGDVAICGTLKEFPSGEKHIVKASFDNEIVLKNDTAFKIMTFQYEYGITITPSATNKVIKRAFLNKRNIRFAENVYYEDLFFSFKTLLYAKQVVCVPKYFIHYFRRDASIIISISKYHIDSFYNVFKKIKSFLESNDLFEEYKFNYYKFGERFYNLIIRQIFEFGESEKKKKELIEYSIYYIKKLITMKEFIEYASAEKLRKHLQPYVESTKIV
jgi:glycosyltransferase involved in cell wall biosynthesis